MYQTTSKHIKCLYNCCFFVNHLTFLDVVDDVGVAYRQGGFYRIHQIQFLCDHQELAYTPKDPP